MAGVETRSLAQRIKAEFDGSSQRAKAAEEAKTQERQDREQRLATFSKVCEELKSVWRPRLDEFAKQLGENVKVTPDVTPTQREAKVTFLTDLANVTLTLSAAANPDLTKLVLDYDLLIIPIFFEYERHARLEMPLDKIDRDAVGKWIDDRLVSCVKAYLSMQDNQYYLRRSMVEDPITKKKFLRQDAAASFEHNGQTHYFTSESSLREYKLKLNLPV